MKKGTTVIVLAALLVATMVGVVSARPNQTPQAAVTTRKVTVPAAFFHPAWDGIDWNNQGGWVALDSGNDSAFSAPVVFPTLSSVTVKKITLNVRDNNASSDACAGMYRTSPPNLVEVKMGEACSTGSGGATSYVDDTITNAKVYPAHGPYIWLNIYGTGIAVYGVTVEYQINT